MAIGPFIPSGDVKEAGLSSPKDFQDKFKDEIKGLPGTMGIAIVDLTTGVPRYATNAAEHVEKHVFSLAKLAPFMAAYRLRERLRNQFGGDPAKTSDELIAKIEKAWKPEVAKKVAGRMSTPDFPQLKRIFNFAGPPTPGKWEFRFLGEKIGAKGRAELVWSFLNSLDEQYHGAIPTHAIETLVFKHRMQLMIRMSDDMAAGSVASDIGLAYIFGVLTTEKLYSSGKHGLWLSNTYGFDNKFMGFESNGDDITAGGTAFAVAEYYTRLFHMKTLVDKQSCEEMIEILEDRADMGTASLFSRDDGIDDDLVTHSKIGLWVPTSNESEAAVIEFTRRTPDGKLKQIKFIAIGLQDLGGKHMGPLAIKMKAFVKKVNQ